MLSFIRSPKWYCNCCGRENIGKRYQCQQCIGCNLYDLCDQCIAQAHEIHPNHKFKLVKPRRKNALWWNRRSKPQWIKGYQMKEDTYSKS